LTAYFPSEDVARRKAIVDPTVATEFGTDDIALEKLQIGNYRRGGDARVR
jgi:hypothetical protein